MKSGTSDNESERAAMPTTASHARSNPASEAAKPTQESQTWDWVDREIWTPRMLAALATASKTRPAKRWFSLIDKVYRPHTLQAAWHAVKANKGAAGIDGQSVARFEANSAKYLSEIADDLRSKRYRADPVRRVEIPKTDGTSRPLGIPTVKDRVVQAALKRVIEPIFESLFSAASFGFRPGRGCKDALRVVQQYLNEGYTHVVDADLKGYFDNIPHQRLLACVAEHISDGRIVGLMGQWLGQDIIKDMQRWTPTGGTPQGAVISPLWANLYLHSLDELLLARGYKVVRYADDFVVLCASAQQAQQALADVQQWVQDNALALNADKTDVGDCRLQGQGFEFLGYRFEAGQRLVRSKSLMKFKDAVRAHTRRGRTGALPEIATELNLLLRGWFAYFQHAHVQTFGSLDGFVRRRLRALLRRRAHRTGFGANQYDHRQWPNSFFASLGLFTMATAHRQASQSR